MTTLKDSLYLTCLLLGSLAQMTKVKSSIYVHQESHFYPANVGDSVTLPCSYEGSAVMFYWYKQTLGQRPRIVSTFNKRQSNTTFHNEFKNDVRFFLEAGHGKNDLKIKDLHMSDSGTYYCIGCYAYDFEFTGGVTVSVQGSGSNVPPLVHQSVSGSLHPGGSVMLNCTVHTGICDGQHSVYWFKDSGQTPPGIIYTQGDRNDQCERKPDTQTDTCVYNLPLNSLSHAGASCAVAVCGHVLFDNQKWLESGSDHGDHLVLVYVLSGALTFTTILVVLLAFAAFSLYKSSSCQCLPEFQVRCSPSSLNTEDSDNLHYAALRKHKINRPPRQREATHSDCVYSSVRQ